MTQQCEIILNVVEKMQLEKRESNDADRQVLEMQEKNYQTFKEDIKAIKEAHEQNRVKWNGDGANLMKSVKSQVMVIKM